MERYKVKYRRKKFPGFVWYSWATYDSYEAAAFAAGELLSLRNVTEVKIIHVTK